MKKQGQRTFSIKFGGLVPESTQNTTAVPFPMKPVQCAVPLTETFYLNDIMQNAETTS